MGRPSKGPHIYERGGLLYLKDGDDFRRSTGFRLGEEKEANKILARYILGAWPDGMAAVQETARKPGELTAVECLIAYADERGSQLASEHLMGQMIAHVGSHWGGLRATELTPRHWQRLYQHLTKDCELAHSSAWTLMKRTQTALRWCADNKLLKDKLGEAWFPPKPQARDISLTRSQVAQLWLATRKTTRQGRFVAWAFYMTALYTGRRAEAIKTLKWRHNSDGGYVDLARGRIDFRRGNGIESNKRRGSIDIPRRLRWVFETLHAVGCEYVFPGQDGAGHLTEYNRRWYRVLALANLEHVHFHDLGHTCATWKADAGVPIHKLSKWISKSVRTLESVYINVPGPVGDVGDV